MGQELGTLGESSDHHVSPTSAQETGLGGSALASCMSKEGSVGLLGSLGAKVIVFKECHAQSCGSSYRSNEGFLSTEAEVFFQILLPKFCHRI